MIPTAVALVPAQSGMQLVYQIGEDALSTAVFPVTIDPRVSFSGTNSSIETTCITDRQKNSTGYNTYQMVTGCSAGSDGNPEFTHITLLKFNELAAKKASDTILSAQLYMTVSGFGSLSKYVCAYPMLKAWEPETATWNSVAADTDEYISERMVSYVSPTNTTHCVFNITDVYNAWYEKDENGNSKNFGIALARPREYSGFDYMNFYGSQYSIAEKRPYVVIDYVSHAGVKGWWTYDTLSCGRAGSANVDLFNGNLIVHHADTSTIGSRMPVSVKHVYNSCQSLSDDFGCGLGWRTSLHQIVRQETVASDTYYIWQDGEGTDHFFKASGSQPYSDSEGMQLKMNLTDTGLTITDKGDTVMAFEKIGADDFPCRLKTVTDPNGNRMELVYNENGKLEKAKDGIDRETVFAYNANGLLSSVTAPGCPVVQYVYASVSGGYNLHRVNYADLSSNQYTEYTYEGSMLTNMKNFDGCELALSYEALCSGNVDGYTLQSRRVKDIEFKNGDVKGTKKVFTYGHMRT
ncbi:MAG: RHS repeat protein, partial [Kiritimatiellae bacterium]|nr:RHS repeat protein [Kiritimatiellia bacterium]